MGGIALLSVMSSLLSVQAQEPKVDVSLLPEAQAFASGRPFDVVVRIDLERPWHIYWKNPGDTGIPTHVEWHLPAGWKAEPVQFPAPKRFESGGTVSYGHEGEILLVSRLTPAPNAKGRFALKATVDWLACIEACVIGQAEVETVVTVGGGSGVAGIKPKVLEQARSGLPKSSEGLQVITEATADGFRLSVGGLPRVSTAYFFADSAGAVAANAQQPLRVDGTSVELTLKRSPYAKEPLAKLSGVLLVTDPEGKSHAYQIESNILRTTNGGT
jgi:thiol:disulfide interchange protein DsbD